jgi:hypothetical protein
MARRPTPPLKPERPILTVEQKRRRIERLQECIQELEAFDPQNVQKRYREPCAAARLDHGPHIARLGPAFGRGPQVDYDAQDAHEARQYFTDGKQQSIVLRAEDLPLDAAPVAPRPRFWSQAVRRCRLRCRRACCRAWFRLPSADLELTPEVRDDHELLYRVVDQRLEER